MKTVEQTKAGTSIAEVDFDERNRKSLTGLMSGSDEMLSLAKRRDDDSMSCAI